VARGGWGKIMNDIRPHTHRRLPALAGIPARVAGVSPERDNMVGMKMKSHEGGEAAMRLKGAMLA